MSVKYAVITCVLLALPVLGHDLSEEADMPLFPYYMHRGPQLVSDEDLPVLQAVFSDLNVLTHADKLQEFTSSAENRSQCEQDMGQIFANIKTSLSIKVLDSWGKPEAGVLQGRLQWLGAYDECLDSAGAFTDDAVWSPQYCRAGLDVGLPFKVRLGVCVSKACSGDDVKNVVQKVIDMINTHSTITAEDSKCTHTKSWSAGDIVVALILSILVSLSLAGTCIDLVRQTRSHVTQREIRKAKLRYCEQHPELENSVVVKVVSSKDSGEVKPGLSVGGVSSFDSAQSTDDVLEEERLRKLNKHRSYKLTGWQRMVVDVLLCWSWLTNGAKLLTPASGGGNLACINGLRTISIWTVILGHTYYFFGETAGNMAHYATMIKRFSFQAIITATFSVDTFFYLSGLLVAYSVMKEMNKRKGKMAWPLYYFHRIWRLTPAYMFVLMVYCTIFRHFPSGPFMNNLDYQPSMTNCHRDWWTNLLYINNLYPGTMTEQCLGWSWYLANDMQFYVVSPIFLILLYKNWKVGVSVLLAACAGCVALTGGVAYSVDYTPIDRRDGTVVSLRSELYVQPWYRISPYFVGLFTGWLLVKCNGKIHWRKRYVSLAWLTCATVMLSLVYGLYEYYHAGTDMPRATAALYTCMSKFLWGAGCAWVTVACLSGYGGPIDLLLSWKIFSPLGRLTYCAYLVHPVVIQMNYLSSRHLHYINDYSVIYLFFAHMMMTYLVAFATSMMVESPMMGLEKIFFRRQPARKPKSPVNPPPDVTSSNTEEHMPDDSDKSDIVTREHVSINGDVTVENGVVNPAFDMADVEKPEETVSNGLAHAVRM